MSDFWVSIDSILKTFQKAMNYLHSFLLLIVPNIECNYRGSFFDISSISIDGRSSPQPPMTSAGLYKDFHSPLKSEISNIKSKNF